MKIRNYHVVICSILFTAPLLVFAFPGNLTGVINMFVDIGLKVIPFLGAVAFLIFVLGVARFIRAAGSEKELKDSKNLLVWGVIGMFILITVWGIIAFLRSEFGFGGGTPLIPQIHIFNVNSNVRYGSQ